MASNKLLTSWNYESITSTENVTDKLTVLDTAGNKTITGVNFSYSVNSGKPIITKEELKTNKKLNFETLESIDTIQTLDQDDVSISLLHKPEGVRLIVENSMNQIISDDMLSMFADIGSLAFKFSEAALKYKDNYKKLQDSREEYFSKVLNKPNLERYMEFYKWLDSSLGYMIDQLKPASTQGDEGLRVTVESHILERPKFKHKLPLSVRRSNTYSSEAITVTRGTQGLASGSFNLNDAVENIVSAENVLNKNYKKTYNYLQTAGRRINYRGTKENKTVFQSRFSAADGLSELNRDYSNEYSVYNSLNRKAINDRELLNISQSQMLTDYYNLRTQKVSSSYYKPVIIPGTTYYDLPPIPLTSGSAKVEFQWNYYFPPVIDPDTGLLTKYLLEAKTYKVTASTLDPYSSEISSRYNVSGDGSPISDKFHINYVLDSVAYSDLPVAKIQKISDYYYFTFDLSTSSCPKPVSGDPDYGSTHYCTFFSDFQLFRLSATYTQQRFLVNTTKKDNMFLRRNLPYYSSSFYNLGETSYNLLPNDQVLENRRNNLIFNSASNIREPVVQFNPPLVHNLRVNGALQDIEIYSPYSTVIDTFSPETLNATGALSRVINGQYVDSRPIFRGANDNNPSDISISSNETFFEIINRNSSSVNIKTIEHLENVFPKKHLMGMREIRSKPNYEEEKGTFSATALTWSQNSYNNNSADIRSFWKDSISDRKKTRGFDETLKTGSFNCLSSPSLSASSNGNQFVYDGAGNFLFMAWKGDAYGGTTTPEYYFSIDSNEIFDYYDSFFALDASASVKAISVNDSLFLTFKNFVIGDLAALPHNLMFHVLADNGVYKHRAKPQFIYNNFFGYSIQQDAINSNKINFYLTPNTSYQNLPDSNLKPSYNSYKDFFSNLKGNAKNFSVIPEFAVSNFDEIITNKGNAVADYTKILGRENFDNLSSYSDSFDINFPKFINKKTNKIKISFNGIKKLLPYNGFYPAQRSVQVVNDFSNSYFTSSLTEKEKQFVLQPFFSPGILFNTIKAGVATDFPVVISASSVPFYNFIMPNLTWKRDGRPEALGQTFIGQNFGTYAVNDFTQKLPFEALLEPKNYLFNKDNNSKYLYYLDPTHYSWLFTSGSSQQKTPIVPSVEISKITEFCKNSTDYYELSINNFLSEIPNFFLQDSQLTHFTTAPENQFGNVVSGAVYQMKVSIDKNLNFSSFKKTSQPDDGEISIGPDQLSEQALFGPPSVNADGQSGWRYFQPFINNGFAPYSPPYYRSGTISQKVESTFKFNKDSSWSDLSTLFSISQESSSIAFNEIRLEFLATKDGKPTVSEIINNTRIVTPSKHSGSDLTAYKWAMTTDDLLLFNQKISSPAITRDPITGKVLQSYDDTSTSKWVIQTKFESPLIDFTDTFTTSSDNPVDVFKVQKKIPSKLMNASIYNRELSIQGIWNSLGTIPKDGQSIQISILDENYDNSLLKILGIGPQSKSIGVLANKKLISEAVVLLPYSISNTQNNEKLYFDVTENKFLFKIEEKIINSLLKVPNYKLLSIKDIKLILETDNSIDKNNSIIDLMIKMVNYNLPPHLNWLFEADKKTPFVIYIGEFTHELDKEELAKIWQNTMPDIAQTPELQTISLEHKVGSDELFGLTNLNDYEIKLRVFKIKKRANNDYKQITLSSTDSNEKIPWYSYNWPYDYFSLVELVNIQAGEVYDSAITGSGSA